MPSSGRTILPALIGTLRLSGASALPAARCGLLLGRRAVGQDRHVLAVITAMRAHHVRPLQLAAILALDIRHRGYCVMGPAHVAAGPRNPFFWDGPNPLPHQGRGPPHPQKPRPPSLRPGGGPLSPQNLTPPPQFSP